jgi:chromate transporter
MTFGGAYAILPYVSQEAVHHFHWLNTEQMMAGMALAETTPGPLIMVLQFVGFMAGWLNPQGGTPLAMATWGALITTWATFFPSFLFIFVGGPLLDRLDSFPVWERFLKWISAVVVGVIAAMGVGFATHVLISAEGFQWIKMGGVLLAVIGILRWKWSPIQVVAGAAAFGWLIGQ